MRKELVDHVTNSYITDNDVSEAWGNTGITNNVNFYDKR